MNSSLDIEQLRLAVEAGRIEWQRHALQRIAERGIPRAAVKAALLRGDRIEDYPDAYPLPSALFIGEHGARPLHIVCALDSSTATAFIITAYEPDLGRFEPDFRTRRKR